MARFVIAPHMRLHEWVAEEAGCFAALHRAQHDIDLRGSAAV